VAKVAELVALVDLLRAKAEPVLQGAKTAKSVRVVAHWLPKEKGLAGKPSKPLFSWSWR
jgi:hypothetical protein